MTDHRWLTADGGRLRKAGGGSPAMLTVLRFTVRRGLAGVWVQGQVPSGPAVWAANHHSWWDPFLAAELLAGARRRPVVLMDPANLRKYRFARRLGVIGTDELRTGLVALRSGAVLVLYPEGRLLPAGQPGPLAEGAAWFAQRAPAALCSAAVRVLLRGGQFPEAYVVLRGVAATGSRAAVTERLHAQLGQDLAWLDQLIARTDARQPLPGLQSAVRARRSWDERIDAARGWLPWQHR